MSDITKELLKLAADPLLGYASQEVHIERLIEIADTIEQELAEWYMKLPTDADGVPVRVGDVMVYSETGLCPKKVEAIVSPAVFLTDEGPRFADMCRHRPDTWESIIADAITEGMARQSICKSYEHPYGVSNKAFVRRCEALMEKLGVEVDK